MCEEPHALFSHIAFSTSMPIVNVSLASLAGTPFVLASDSADIVAALAADDEDALSRDRLNDFLWLPEAIAIDCTGSEFSEK